MIKAAQAAKNKQTQTRSNPANDENMQRERNEREGQSNQNNRPRERRPLKLRCQETQHATRWYSPSIKNPSRTQKHKKQKLPPRKVTWLMSPFITHCRRKEREIPLAATKSSAPKRIVRTRPLQEAQGAYFLQHISTMRDPPTLNHK